LRMGADPDVISSNTLQTTAENLAEFNKHEAVMKLFKAYRNQQVTPRVLSFSP